MTWSLYENEKFLEPLCFSNGKTQEKVVQEVLEEIEKGEKVIFIRGICGTGKSAIALNIARKLGKTSIVVPIKNLQMQYKKDYETNKYVLKDNGEKLKISVITGRNNHECQFLKDRKSAIPVIKREIDSSLHDIFSGKKKEVEDMIQKNISADNPNIPCKIEIKEKNWDRIKKYIQQNKKVNLRDFSSIKDVKRMSIAVVCPYWSPVLPEKYDINFEGSKRKEYEGVGDSKCIFHQRKSGCKFYEQFNSYINSDVIIFNALKYKYETGLGRKPQTEVEIIDECDEFLDSYANQRNLNVERLLNSIIQTIVEDDQKIGLLKEMIEIIKQIKNNERISNSVNNGEIIPLKETGIYDLFSLFIKNYDLINEIDEESYLFEVYEIVRTFDEFLNETYVTFGKKENNLIASLVTTNLEKKFKEMVERNKVVVLMSGTLHSENVLKEIFGLDSFKIIEAEVEKQGRIDIKKTGLEIDCKYSNFSSGKHSREDYLKALSKCIKDAPRPTLVHVNAFIDLPSEDELREYDIDNLISREKLRELQSDDKTGKIVKRFKKGQTDILFSTKASRGIDFPGEQCNSIVFTKYPNPNVQDAFWKILMKTQPNHYWNFYRDKAKRELWQKVYRGLRSKNDHVYVLSPDSRVLDNFIPDVIPS